MSSVRPTGAGMPNMLRINGQEITQVPSTPSVEGPRPAGGVPASNKPVPGPADTSAQMEHMFDEANDASIRGENAAAMLQGRKSAGKRNLRKPKKKENVDHRRVEGVFPDGDPHNKQEQAFQDAAEFEEKVKETDLTFKRKAGQVEAGQRVFQADIDNGNGALVMGEARSVDFQFHDDEEPTHATGTRISVTLPAEDTVPNMESPLLSSSETELRRVLGLKKK